MSLLHGFLVSVFVTFCVGRSLTTEYVEYIPSTGLNVILSAPHGGYDIPEGIPSRTHGCWIDEECVYRHGCGQTDSSRYYVF